MQDNESSSHVSSCDDEMFHFMPEMLDLLVDGELSENERRQVLQYLDKTNNGWRDCAMTFLEAALFKESLASDSEQRTNMEELFGVPSSVDQKSNTDRISRDLGFSALFKKSNFVMIAAGFLVAFLFYGVVFYVIGLPTSGPASHLSPNSILVNHEGGMSLLNRAAVSNPMFSPMSSVAGSDMQYVTLDSCNPEWKGMRIPCYSAKTIDPKTYLAHFPVLENEQVQELLDAGHEVNVHRQNIVIPVNDGRRVVIPVDQVNVRYRSQPQFQ